MESSLIDAYAIIGCGDLKLSVSEAASSCVLCRRKGNCLDLHMMSCSLSTPLERNVDTRSIVVVLLTSPASLCRLRVPQFQPHDDPVLP